MRLFVDDIRNAPEKDWTVARSVDSAINFISQFGMEITEISLDHDISHQVSVGKNSRPFPCVETFTAVARYIAEYYDGEQIKPLITIHTSNPMGAKNIEFILQDFTCKRKSYGITNRLEQEI